MWDSWGERLFLKFRKNFSGGGDIEFGEKRTPQEGQLPIAIKTQASGFGREEKFSKQGLSSRIEKRRKEGSRKRRSSSRSSGLVKENERARWDC